MWPCTVASLNRTGSIAVAVNLSPARDSLLDSVSFNLIFKLVPMGTSGGAAVVRRAGFFRLGLVVCALAIAGIGANVSRIVSAILLLKFIYSSLGDSV